MWIVYTSVWNFSWRARPRSSAEIVDLQGVRHFIVQGRSARDCSPGPCSRDRQQIAKTSSLKTSSLFRPFIGISRQRRGEPGDELDLASRQERGEEDQLKVRR